MNEGYGIEEPVRARLRCAACEHTWWEEPKDGKTTIQSCPKCLSKVVIITIERCPPPPLGKVQIPMSSTTVSEGVHGRANVLLQALEEILGAPVGSEVKTTKALRCIAVALNSEAVRVCERIARERVPFTPDADAATPSDVYKHVGHDVTFGKGGPGGRCSDCHEDLTDEQGKAVTEEEERMDREASRRRPVAKKTPTCTCPPRGYALESGDCPIHAPQPKSFDTKRALAELTALRELEQVVRKNNPMPSTAARTALNNLDSVRERIR